MGSTQDPTTRKYPILSTYLVKHSMGRQRSTTSNGLLYYRKASENGAKVRIERELMRGAGPIAVMQLIETREMYGYELVESLTRITEGVLAIGQSTLYPMLYNLEAKGLIEGEWREAASGRKRKYYSLAPKGITHLESHRKQWRDLAGAMENLGLLG